MTLDYRVSVIGLGAMGLPMAARLATRLPVAAFDLDRSRLALAAEAGARPTASPAEAAEDARVVVLAVRTLEQAQTALFGADGAAGRLGPGAVVLLTSTVGSDGARGIGARLSAASIGLVDAPVSGGPVRAAAGDLLIFLGGDPESRLAVAPVLDLLASNAVVIGDKAGDGQTMKTVNQLLCGVHIAAAAEALALAKALGLDIQTAVDVLGAGAAASFMLANRGPRMVQALQGKRPPVLSRSDIFVKDMRIVTEAASSAGISTPLAAVAERLYMLAEIHGLGADDDSTLTTLLSNKDFAGEVRELLRYSNNDD